MEISEVITRYGTSGKQALLDALLEHNLAVAMDGECVDSVDDYGSVIDELLGLAGVKLASEAAAFEEGAARRIRLVDEGRELTGEVEGETDWIDQHSLLRLLNAVLDGRKLETRLWHVWDSDLFGQDFAVVLARESEAYKIYECGLPVDIPDANGQLPILPANGLLDGHRAIGYAEGAYTSRKELKKLVNQLADLTDGVLQISSIKIDFEKERLIIELPDRILKLSTINDDLAASLAESPDGGVIGALNLALAELNDDRIFGMIFGPRADTWIIVCVTQEQYLPLQDKYN